MAFGAGFLDLEKQIFYSNFGTGHWENARSIIFNDPELKALHDKEPTSSRFFDPEEFLIFKMNFAKIGMSSKSNVVISAKNPYKMRINQILRNLNFPDGYKILEWV